MKRLLTPPPRSILFLTPLYAATAAILYLAATRTFQPVPQFENLRVVLFALFFPILFKYLIQLSAAPLHLACEAIRRRRQTGPQPTPSVSLLIPAWNEEVGILKTVRSALNAAYPNLQVIVINDGSTDATDQRVRGFIAENRDNLAPGHRLTYLSLENGGKARALNRALKHATGEIIITLDADSVMDPDAIANMVARFTSPRVGAVAGNVIVGNKRKPIEWMQQIEYVYGFFMKRADAMFNSVYIIGGAAAAYRRDVLERVGGFDHSIITEDIEMSTRILWRGYKTRYAPDAVVYTEGPSDWAGLCNQRLRWKHGRILTFLKHHRLFFSFRRRHNPYLSFMLLPLAVYAELMLLFEAVLLGTFLLYTVMSGDYLPMAFVVLLITSVVSLQVALDPKARFHRNLYLLAPIAWLLFYGMDMIEFQALVRSLKRLAKRQELQWQKWTRVGVTENGQTPGLGLPSLTRELN